MRNILITGSSRGIGFGIARAFASQGDCHIMLNGRDTVQLEKAHCELANEYPNIYISRTWADFSDYANADSAISTLHAKFGAIDVLVNNAGVAHFGLFSDMSHGEIQQVLADNLHTALNASHCVIPQMVRAKSGCIINITSIWGITGASCEVAYSTAKAGLIGLTKSLAKELAPSGIRVNAIACGAFETRMNDRLDKNEKNAFMESIPMGRFGEPREVGGLAVFLASEDAEYITGQIIGMDGGLI